MGLRVNLIFAILRLDVVIRKLTGSYILRCILRVWVACIMLPKAYVKRMHLRSSSVDDPQANHSKVPPFCFWLCESYMYPNQQFLFYLLFGLDPVGTYCPNRRLLKSP